MTCVGDDTAMPFLGAPDAYSAATEASQLRTRNLHEALAQAARAVDAPSLQRTANFARVCVESKSMVLVTTALLALAILLVTRPPFVLQFEHDARRPWKGSVRMSWSAIVVTVLLLLAAVAGIPLLRATPPQ